ncbi:AAC_collapsed_G0008270.mRNA.1.CDS.1 [Saccharomyces cerevisiae]|nr:AAC_collapsed_G0008270.mRNA.1.CDS.1 [Saccharomyces cerevisiae]
MEVELQQLKRQEKLSGNYSTAPTNKKKKTLKFLEKDEIINNNNYSDSEEDNSDSSDSDSD